MIIIKINFNIYDKYFIFKIEKNLFHIHMYIKIYFILKGR